MLDTEFALFPIVDDLDIRRLFAHYRGALKTISHQIEDAVLNGGVYTRVFAGFQKFSFFLPQLERYRELARVADGIWIFGIPDVPLPPIPGVTYMPITVEHALTQEWFLVVNSPEYFSALVAQDLSGFTVPDEDRRFRGIWTFDGTVVGRLEEKLSEVIELRPSEVYNGHQRDYRRQLNQLTASAGKLIDTLEQRNLKLKQAQQLREDLSNMLVHDLRTPLAAVVASLDLLRGDGNQFEDDKVQTILGIAHANAQTLKDMVNDLLDIAKLEEGKLTFYRSPLDPTDLLVKAADLAHTIALRGGKRLKVEIREPLPTMMGEREKISRVLNNLLNNALKYTDANGCITLSAQPEGDYVQFAVSDDGPGVPEEARERIFDKFAQAGGGTQRQGTGLGLTFCRLIVEAHGGKIWVESEPGQGSTFYFTLPKATA